MCCASTWSRLETTTISSGSSSSGQAPAAAVAHLHCPMATGLQQEGQQRQQRRWMGQQERIQKLPQLTRRSIEPLVKMVKLGQPWSAPGDAWFDRIDCGSIITVCCSVPCSNISQPAFVALLGQVLHWPKGGGGCAAGVCRQRGSAACIESVRFKMTNSSSRGTLRNGGCLAPIFACPCSDDCFRRVRVV